jgi:hypothetical protein
LTLIKFFNGKEVYIFGGIMFYLFGGMDCNSNSFWGFTSWYIILKIFIFSDTVVIHYDATGEGK